MNNKKQKIASIIAILLIISMIISIVAPFAQIVFGKEISVGETSKEVNLDKGDIIDDGSFDVDVEVGFDGEFILYNETPIKINIQSNKNDFLGKVLTKIYVQDGYLSSSSSNIDSRGLYVEYYEDIDIAKGVKKEYSFSTLMNTANPFIEINIVDNKENIIYKNNFYVKPLDPNTIATAILTDDFSNMKYINSIDLYDDFMLDKVVMFDKNTFPQNKNLLSNFKNIIISNFDVMTLNQNQVQAIEQWVKHGGNILFGTGRNEMRSLSAFSELFDINVTNSKPKDFNMYNQLNGMYVSDIEGSDFETLLEDEGTVFLKNKKYGNGNIIVATFDLALDPFTKFDKNIELIKLAFESDDYEEISGLNFRPDNNSYSYMSSKIPLKDEFKIYIIFALVILYLIIIGPVLYLVLRKKDKKEYAWIFIPIFSFIFMFIIFTISQTSYYKNNILGVVSRVKVPNGEAYGEAFMNISASSYSIKDINVELSENLPIIFNKNMPYYYNRNGFVDQCLAKINTGNKSSIIFPKKEMWDSNDFQSNKVVDLGGALTLDVAFKENGFNVNINNATKHNFENAILLINNIAFNIGDIDSNQEINKVISNAKEGINFADSSYYNKEKAYLKGLDLEEVGIDDINDYYNYNDTYDIYRKLYNSKKYLKEDIFNHYIRRELFTEEFSSRNTFQDSHINAKLYCFDSNEILNSGTIINGKDSLNIINNIYIVSDDISYSDVDNYMIPFGIIQAEIVQNEVDKNVDYDFDYNYNYIVNRTTDDKVGSVSEIPFLFSLKGFENIKSFKISSYVNKNIKEEIFNIQTGEYELLEPKEKEFTDTNNYIDEFGNVKIKISYPNNDYFEYTFPEISITVGVN